MDLSSSKVSNSDKLDLCRKYFYIGLGAFLPFLWAVNAVWFARTAFTGPDFEEKKDIRKFVLASAVGALVYIAGFAVWISVFTANRTAWGAVGDHLSFNIPTGN